MADIGHGATITFAESEFVATLRSISGPTMTLESVDSSHMGGVTVGAIDYAIREFVPGMLDPGELTCEVVFDPEVLINTGKKPFSVRYMVGGWDDSGGVTEVVTITWPPPYDKTTGAKWESAGFITSFSPEAPMEDLMTATLTIRLTASPTFTTAV